MTPKRRLTTFTIMSAAFISACTSGASEAGTTRNVAEDTIADELADELGAGELAARCPEVDSPTRDISFLCMATTTDEQTVRIQGTINDAGGIDLATTNVIRAGALDVFERQAVADINGSAGSQLVDSDLECGDQAKILNSNKEMVCAVNNNGGVYDITFTVNDIEGAQFDLEVAELPRE